MFERRLGPEHPTIGKFKINLGVLRFEQGDLAGAEADYREGLAVLEKAVGREHPDLAGGLGNLAEVLRLRGRTREAVEVATRAASLVTSRDDVEAVERADVQAELARALLAAGERARADDHARGARHVPRRRRRA